jgi:1-acyl-sn-glycerol-3-phosphate acyltransferase
MTVRVIVMFAFLTIFYMIAPIPYLNKIRKYAPHIFVNIIMPICGIFHSGEAKRGANDRMRYSSMTNNLPLIAVRGSEYKNAVHVDKCIFVCNHISNFDPIWFNCVFKDFTLLCAGDYDWFWEAMKR